MATPYKIVKLRRCLGAKDYVSHLNNLKKKLRCSLAREKKINFWHASESIVCLTIVAYLQYTCQVQSLIILVDQIFMINFNVKIKKKKIMYGKRVKILSIYYHLNFFDLE